MNVMKNIIKFIIDQELTILDDYTKLIDPISKEFSLSSKIATDIINVVIEWESNEGIHDSLEKYLINKFPNIVTN